MARRKRRWIKRALRKHRRGALHRMLGVPVGKKIPRRLLMRYRHARGKLGQRVRFALNVRRRRR